MYDNTLVSFENSFYEGPLEVQDIRGNQDALACITIDGYPLDDSIPGRTVARIWLTKHGDIIVDFHDYAYALCDRVKELVDDSRQRLLKDFEELQ